MYWMLPMPPRPARSVRLCQIQITLRCRWYQYIRIARNLNMPWPSWSHITLPPFVKHTANRGVTVSTFMTLESFQLIKLRNLLFPWLVGTASSGCKVRDMVCDDWTTVNFSNIIVVLLLNDIVVLYEHDCLADCFVLFYQLKELHLLIDQSRVRMD